MSHTKESIAQAAGLQHLLDLSANEPLQAQAAIGQLRPQGISSIRSKEDALLAFCLGRTLRQIDKHAEALELLRAVSAYAQDKALLNFAGNCELELAAVYIAQNNAESGIPHAERSLEFAMAEDNPISIAHSKQKLATLLAMKGEDELSIQYYLDAINVFERLSPQHVHSALNNYSHHFFKRGDSEAGLKLLYEAAAKCDNAGGRSIYFLNIATAQLDLGRVGAALEASTEAIELATQFGRESTLAKAKVIHAHALSLASKEEHFEQSIGRIDEAEQCFDRFEHLPSQAISLVYRAKLAALKGHCTEALSYLHEAQALDLTDRLTWDLVFAQTIEQVQTQCANWADAYSALKHFDQMSDSLRSAESTRMLYANPVGVLRQHAANAEAEVLKEQLAQRSKDLVAIREETAQVRSEIDTIVNQTRDRDTLVRALRKQINAIPERLDYQTFQMEFSQGHPTFFSSLKALYPDLTDIQLRICCVTRAGLRSPEAAKLLHLSERTIQNHRYRLKKLFDLDQSDSLLRFLKRF
jgi:tetratricopeptide (TPR) repeat protein